MKLSFAASLGADLVINYTDQNWPEQLIRSNSGEKVDIVMEMVGGDIYTQSFSCLKSGGKMIVYGRLVLKKE